MANSSPEQRKLIRFGNSSYIIAIPKSWITKNKLKKGDLIFIEETPNNEIVIKTKADKSKEAKTISIEFDGKDLTTLRREIGSAYINNFSEITLSGKSLNQKMGQISKIVQDKVGLEISEQGPEKVVIRDILDFEAISADKVVRRLDNIIRSMFDDIKTGIGDGKIKDWTIKEIYNADAGINKFYFLGWKIIRKCQDDPRTLQKLKLDSKSVSDIQWLVLHMEYTGDELKRLAKLLYTKGVNHKEELMQSIVAIEREYLEMINSFYNKDIQTARNLSTKKKSMMEMYEKLFLKKTKNNKEGVETIVEKLKAITSYIHNISKVIGY